MYNDTDDNYHYLTSNLIILVKHSFMQGSFLSQSDNDIFCQVFFKTVEINPIFQELTVHKAYLKIYSPTPLNSRVGRLFVEKCLNRVVKSDRISIWAYPNNKITCVPVSRVGRLCVEKCLKFLISLDDDDQYSGPLLVPISQNGRSSRFCAIHQQQLLAKRHPTVLPPFLKRFAVLQCSGSF